MKALSIRQPWAWSIIRPDIIGAEREQILGRRREDRQRFFKDFENRSWFSQRTGDILIHAGKTIDKGAYEFLEEEFDMVVPAPGDLLCGYVIGIVTIEAHRKYRESNSPWAFTAGFDLVNPRIITPFPYPGKLGFFEIPYEAAA